MAESEKEVSLSQRSYVLDMLLEVGMLGCEVANKLVNPNLILLPD